MGKRTTGRISITTNVPDGVSLAEKVYTKHQADGAASPLNNLDDVDWAVTGPKLKTCRQQHDLAEQLKKDSEKAYAIRDAIYAEVTEILRVSKNTLKGRFTKNPKKIGDWGFQIDDTPPPKKDKPKE
jgi:hypothetical protein